MIEEMYRRLLGDVAWDAWPPDVQSQRGAEGRAFQADMASELRSPCAVEEVTVSALVGYGTQTSAVHVRGARWLAAQLPHARIR